MSDPRHPVDDAVFASMLAAVGDDLEAAVEAQLHRARNTSAAPAHLLGTPTEEKHMSDTHSDPDIATSPGRPRRRLRPLVAVGLLAGAVAVRGGVAAAAGVFSNETVERGMPGGSVLFTDTDPSCTSTDGVVFDCVLDHAPTAEVLDDYLDTSETIVDEDSIVNGACVGEDSAGIRWTCYIGQRAVDEGLVGQGFLGEKSGPSSG